MKKIVLLLVSILLMGPACNRPSFDEEDIIEQTQGEVVNAERLYEFYENTVNGKEDAVRVIRYTIEGDPLYQDLSTNGDGIKSVEDSSEDRFSSGDVATRLCDSIVILSSEAEQVYVLEGCEPESGMDVILHEGE